jgi:CelD/BcsL family acetyltransferase involved in cellulose biosynthesis
MTSDEAAAHGLQGSRRATFEPVGDLEELREEWTDLANEDGNIFSTWEWASSWWRHVGHDRPLLIHAARRDDGRLAAVVPTYLWSSRPLRIGRFVGHGPADQLGVVSRTLDPFLTAEALRHVLSSFRLDVLLAELLPGGNGWPAAFGSNALARESSPTLLLAGGWEAYLASRSANLRQQIRRRERRLRGRYGVRFRLAADRTRLQDDLSLLFTLHFGPWPQGRSAFASWESFHREFAALALERGWLRLWFLELDDRPVAAWYGFRFSGVESYYQAGRDLNFRDDSVGFVLLAHSIREAAVDGMREYRFLRGAEPYKLRFADADPGLETYALTRGVAGKAAAAAAGAAFRSAFVRSGLRRVVGRRGAV